MTWANLPTLSGLFLPLSLLDLESGSGLEQLIYSNIQQASVEHLQCSALNKIRPKSLPQADRVNDNLSNGVRSGGHGDKEAKDCKQTFWEGAS